MDNEDYVFIRPDMEIIAPSSKIKGINPFKIKLTNQEGKEVIIYPLQIEKINNTIVFSIPYEQLKYIDPDGKIIFIDERRKR